MSRLQPIIALFFYHISLMNRLFSPIFFLLVLFSCCTASVAQPGGQRPQVFTTDTPFVHDPVMAYENGLYHAYYTGQYIGHMTSSNRRTWTVYRDGVLRDMPRWTHDSVPGFKHHVWAPDVIRWHDRWWMAYSCSTFGKNTSAIGLLSATSLAAADWQDRGCLVASKEQRDNWNAIDPNFIEDTDGQLWLTWGSFWDGIQMAPLHEQTGRDGQPTLRLAGPMQTIARRYGKRTPQGVTNPTSKYAGTNAIEAPFVLRHDGYYYLFVSWDYCCQGMKSTYRVVVGRSKSVCGPYLDREGKPMAEGGGTPVIAGDKQVYEAAGHSAAYHFADGDLFICHGYAIDKNGMSVLIQKNIKWVKGWPLIELGVRN